MTVTGIHDLREALGYWARNTPDKIAFGFMPRGEDVTESLTFSELHSQAVGLASVIAQRIGPREPALLIYPTGLPFIVTIFACFLAGVIAVPAPQPQTDRARARTANIRAAAGAQVILTTEAIAQDKALRERLGSDCDWITTDLAVPTADFPAREWRPEDTALIQFTSGSTAIPRGVTISFGNLMANHAMIAQIFGADPSEPSVTWLPVFHDMGLIGTILYPLQAGRSTYIMPTFAFLQKPVRWVRAISRFRATGSGAPSFAYDLCARMVSDKDREGLDLSSWTTAFCGAEPVRVAALRRFADAFAGAGFCEDAFLPCYGLAEATLFVSGGPPRSGLRTVAFNGKRVVSCGKVLSPQIVRIIGPEGDVLPDGEQGEICVSGPHVSEGYWRDEVAAAATFHARLADGTDGDFLKTGDLGFLQSGELFVTGRTKDIFIIRGVKHHGNDLDDTISSASSDLVHGAGAVFVEEAETDGGDRIVAVHEVSRRSFANFDPDALARSVREAVTRVHGFTLDQVFFVREGRLPRTTSGKIQRHLCRAFARSDAAADEQIYP